MKGLTFAVYGLQLGVWVWGLPFIDVKGETSNFKQQTENRKQQTI